MRAAYGRGTRREKVSAASRAGGSNARSNSSSLISSAGERIRLVSSSCQREPCHVLTVRCIMGAFFEHLLYREGMRIYGHLRSEERRVGKECGSRGSGGQSREQSERGRS